MWVDMPLNQSINLFFPVEKNGEFVLKDTHDYYHQIQGQLYITGASCAHLMIWTIKDVKVVEVKKDPAWAENIIRLKSFYFTTFMDMI